MLRYDIVIIGAGIYGCSLAKYLSERSNLKICVIDKEYHPAKHQSARNSGTLHPGLAFEYKPNSFHSKLAIDGIKLIKEYCNNSNIAINDKGLLVLATSAEEISELEKIQKRVSKYDVQTKLLSYDSISKFEPNIECEMGLLAPISATVDSYKITQMLAIDAHSLGVDFMMGYKVNDLTNTSDGVFIKTDKGNINAGFLVNVAGAWATELAHLMGVGKNYHVLPMRGQYYELIGAKQSYINTNVYPTPSSDHESVGVHFTRRPDNKVIVGPTGNISIGPETYTIKDVNLNEMHKYVLSKELLTFINSKEKLQISLNELDKTYRKKRFVKEAQKLIPELKSDDLRKSYTGIGQYVIDSNGERIKEPIHEFSERSVHLIQNVPGITCSLSTADYISNKILSKIS